MTPSRLEALDAARRPPATTARRGGRARPATARASALELPEQPQVGVVEQTAVGQNRRSAVASVAMSGSLPTIGHVHRPCRPGIVVAVHGRRSRAAVGVLHRQRGLPLPRPGVRGAAVRARRRARRGVAADRLGRADLRALAPAVARVRRAGRAPDAACSCLGGGPGADERVLLHRHRPAAARHGRGDRVPAGDRARGARRAHAAQRRSRSRSPSPASTC